MRRYGKPEELVGAALLLLSQNAGSYMTGSIVERRWRFYLGLVLISESYRYE